jgi:hypothetical protein
MRFAKFPLLILNEYKQLLETYININPFSIEAYLDDVVEYVSDTGQTSANITTIILRSGKSFELFMPIEEFEQVVNQFYAQ